MITPFPAGGLFNRSTMNAKLEEIGGAITEAGWQLIQILDNTGPMSGTWTAPDFFGDGGSYDLGVYEIGGGGSGGARASSTAATSGGASGYGKNFIINNVIPGAEYPYIIGAKGSGVSGNLSGNTGGTTSFGGEEAEGGEGGGPNPAASGGQGTDDTVWSWGASAFSPRRLYGCCPTLSGDSPSGTSQSPREGQNQFDATMISLCAGGSCTGQTAQTIVPMPDGTKGGNGAVGGNAESATGYGNGGGASLGGTSGSGSDGAIYLYARRSQEVTA